VQIDGYFPSDKVDYRHHEQGNREKATHKEHWCEHHHMIPVENAAGGAAFVTEHESEGTPNKHTNEIANVKRDTDKEKVLIIKYFEMLERAYSRNKSRPKRHYLPCRLVGLDHIVLELIPINKLMDDGTEFFLEKFL
jgi:hypothetical protein